MKKYKYGISFRLEKRRTNPKDKNSKLPTKNLPIRADITFSGLRFFYFTGYRIDLDSWDAKAGKVKRNNFNSKGESASEINTRLGRIEVAIDNVFNRLGVNKIPATIENVRDELKKELNEDTENVSRKTIIEYYQMLVDLREKELKESPNIAKWQLATLKKHKTMIRHIIGFRKQLYFEDMTEETLQKLEMYLVGKNLSNSYVHKSMKDIKTFLNWATKMGYNNSLTYQQYQQVFKGDLSHNNANMFALTEDELKTLHQLDLSSSASLDRTRDMFLFGCYSSLRYSDIHKLKWDDIVDGTINVISKKTNHFTRIEMNETLKNIVAKYPKIEGHRIFPSISNQKYNEQLKKLGEIAGFNEEMMRVKKSGNHVDTEKIPKYKLLSSHVARRTFVTRALRMGWSPEMIKAVTGHTTSKMMMSYVKMDMNAKREFMSQLDISSGVETVFDFEITDEERQLLGIPDKAAYLPVVSKDKSLGELHLAYLFKHRGDSLKSLDYALRLPDAMKVEFMNTITAKKSEY